MRATLPLVGLFVFAAHVGGQPPPKPPVAADQTTLEARIKPITDKHKGKIAVAVKNLATGEGYVLNAEEVMQTASLIKLAVMVEAYRQLDAKKVDFAKTLTLTKDDKVPGAGVLTSHFSDGATFPLKDAVRLMIVFSDNTATNMVLDQIGIKAVNDTTKELGLPETRINAKVFKGSTTSVDPERTKKYSLGSTSAAEMVKLMELIHDGKAASAEACQAMLTHMKANDDKELLVRHLPPGTAVAHKTGATNKVRTDAGIMYVPDPTHTPKEKESKRTIPVAVCVLTNENEDERWVRDNAAQVTIGDIGKAVYEHHAGKR
jgi:beta-lactamase class A